MKLSRTQMDACRVSCVALLSVAFLTGCRGSIGWDRMPGSLQGKTRSDVHRLQVQRTGERSVDAHARGIVNTAVVGAETGPATADQNAAG